VRNAIRATVTMRYPQLHLLFSNKNQAQIMSGRLQQPHKIQADSQNAATSFDLLVCTVFGASKENLVLMNVLSRRMEILNRCAMKPGLESFVSLLKFHQCVILWFLDLEHTKLIHRIL
jgi:hypothetical protein